MRLLAILILIIAGRAEAQWISVGIGFTPFTTIGVHDTSLFAGNDGAVSRYSPWEPKFKWQPAYAGIYLPDGPVTSFANLGSLFYCSQTILDPFGRFQSNGTAYFTTDNGSHWTGLYLNGPVFSNSKYLFGTLPSEFDPHVPYLVRTKDSAKVRDSVLNISVSKFGGIGTHVLASSLNLWHSSDNGGHWDSVHYPLPLPLTFASVGPVLFAAGYIDYNGPAGPKGLAFSLDSGASWQKIDFPHWVRSLVSHESTIFAGTTDSGVYVSWDTGKNWHTVNEGLDSYLNVSALCVFDTELFISTASGGKYNVAHRPLREMVPPKSAVLLPVAVQDTILIYPNPTLHSITIQSGDELQHVELLSLLGESLQLVAPRSATATLDLSGLPSGTYFLRIETAKGVVFRKVVRE
jgi:hypothetical protein